MPLRPRSGPLVWIFLLATASIHAAEVPADAPLTQFTLPREWQDRFWAGAGAKAVAGLDTKALAALVPQQAGLRYCRCPSCDATEQDDPLSWSAENPGVVTCRRCHAAFPNDQIPAKVGPPGPDCKVPEDAIEVLRHVVHHYPYHGVPLEQQRLPDERLYLAAKRDYEAREFLAKTALYAALKSRETPQPPGGPDHARLACTLVLRFAQVYPAYAVHFDQPGHSKILQPANLPPPYRQGYGTAKWDWSGCLDVPLNLVLAYALVRNASVWDAVGRDLGEARPRAKVENDLFRASANFVLKQPDPFQEESLLAYRGLLAVGRLLDDRALTASAMGQLERFAERGFTHDGLWRGADLAAHQRVVAQLDGWLAKLLPGTPPPPPIFHLARTLDPPRKPVANGDGVTLASWPDPTLPNPTAPPAEGPGLLGGAARARLALGRDAGRLVIDLRGFGDLGRPHSNRLSLRLAVGGRPILGDLDDLPSSPGGFEHATASHNTVTVDGLNQRETLTLARRPSLASNCIFFAADPDFQVACLDDPRAYPITTTRYRHTVVASAGPASSYAVSVFEVSGGNQHDQFVHAAPGLNVQWELSTPTRPGPASLLPKSITRVHSIRPDDGRWFVQAMGEFGKLHHASVAGPTVADLTTSDGPGVRLHLFPQAPQIAFLGTTPNPLAASAGSTGRSAMILRRRSTDGSPLSTAFVTVFEPTGPGAIPLKRVGRVASPDGTIALVVETADGPEHLVFHLSPAKKTSVTLTNGNVLATDALVVRARGDGLTMAGGTTATLGPWEIRESTLGGTIRQVLRRGTPEGLGVFLVDETLADPASLAGRTLLIRHGEDGPVRGWTLQRVEPPTTRNGLTRLVVREEPGFTIDPQDGRAHDYQVPRGVYPGPHTFRIATIARSPGSP